MNRNERHAAILRLVREQPLSTQTELADALRREGHEVVQTTVSRDIHELGLIKVRHASGRLVYAFAEDGGYSEELSEALTRWALTRRAERQPRRRHDAVRLCERARAGDRRRPASAHRGHDRGREHRHARRRASRVTGEELADELHAQRLQGAA